VPTSKQRREAARRHLERQLEHRQAQEAARKKRMLIATIAGTLVLALIVVIFVVVVTHNGNTKSAAASATPSAAPPTTTHPVAKYPCTWTKSGAPAKPATVPSTTQPPKTGRVVADMATTRGSMVFTLDRAKAPCTVASFESLVKQGYYNNTPCHRLVTQGIYVLQCGDPTGKGTGGPGYTIPDEYTGKEKYTRGVIAMANSGSPNSGGSQFFITYKNDSLPAQYTIFGTVTGGLSVVDKVAAAGANSTNGPGDGTPKLSIKLSQLTVKAS
jgi:peptidyl-prolyl cis-trans isomerase B (cyclophilin B)